MIKKIKREINFENQFVKLRIASEDPKEKLTMISKELQSILIGDNPIEKPKKKTKKDKEEPKIQNYIG